MFCSMCTEVLLKQQRIRNEFFKIQLKYYQYWKRAHVTKYYKQFLSLILFISIPTVKVQTERASYVCYLWFLG